jgi:hypothetical protein
MSNNLINYAYVMKPQKIPNQLGAGGHICNPGYSGGRDQEDCGLKPDPGK